MIENKEEKGEMRKKYEEKEEKRKKYEKRKFGERDVCNEREYGAFV